jgi:hypothetical protein
MTKHKKAILPPFMKKGGKSEPGKSKSPMSEMPKRMKKGG